MIEYQTVEVTDKPGSAPAKLTVYVIDGERHVFCPVRKKLYKIDGKPEELVRQWWLYRLQEVYKYDLAQLDVEVPVTVGSSEAKKKADIVVYKDRTKKSPRVFIEVKKPNRKDGVDQLQVYMNATGCRLGLWSNGSPPHVYLLRAVFVQHGSYPAAVK